MDTVMMKPFSRRCGAGEFLTALALLMSACTAHDKPSSVETAIANAAKDIVIPIQAKSLKDPLHADPQTVGQGRFTCNSARSATDPMATARPRLGRECTRPRWI